MSMSSPFPNLGPYDREQQIAQEGLEIGNLRGALLRESWIRKRKLYLVESDFQELLESHAT
jgi:hypothetical protein